MKKSDVFGINRKLGRGVNILGYDPIWKTGTKARMKDEHFRLIKEAGFSNVRIPLHPFRDSAINEKNKVAKSWFETLDWAIEQSLSNRLMPIIDFHEFGTMGQNPLGNKKRFLATWQQMGERLKDCPDEVVFEILNEPNKELTPELWNQFHSEALEIIRRTNPTRAVIIGPAFWNSIDYLDKLEPQRATET